MKQEDMSSQENFLSPPLTRRGPLEDHHLAPELPYPYEDFFLLQITPKTSDQKTVYMTWRE